jgi:hypothetical protein
MCKILDTHTVYVSVIKHQHCNFWHWICREKHELLLNPHFDDKRISRRTQNSLDIHKGILDKSLS